MSKLLPALGPVVDSGTDAPSMPYWQMFTGQDGLSSVAMATLDGFVEKTVGGKAAAMWMRSKPYSLRSCPLDGSVSGMKARLPSG